MRALIHVHNYEIIQDDELTYLNWDILKNTHMMLDQMICKLNSQIGDMQIL